jgi:phosphoesterase RecJ-like protein
MDQVEKLKNLINDAPNILITSHIGPDGDSVSSSLLLCLILKFNYPDKTINVSMEEKPYGLDFLPGIDSIIIDKLQNCLEQLKPDLLFMLDAGFIYRVTRDPDPVNQILGQGSPKLAVIDHHEHLENPIFAAYINNDSPAVTLDIYEIFIEKLGLKKPAGYAQLAMTGIYTDTGGFVNRNLNYHKTFEVVPKLIQDGANIEAISNQLNTIGTGTLEVLKEFMNNLSYYGQFTYSFLSDNFIENLGGDNKDYKLESLKSAGDVFRSNYIRNIEGHPMGFIVYRDLLAPTQTVSFRALAGGTDVAAIAAKLGGGGHKPAAGAKIQAASIGEALQKVKAAIS